MAVGLWLLVVWKTGISIPRYFQVLGHVSDSRLCRRHFLFFPLFPRVQEPAAICLRLRVLSDCLFCVSCLTVGRIWSVHCLMFGFWPLAVNFWLFYTSCWNLRLSESRVKLGWVCRAWANWTKSKRGISIPWGFQVLGHVADSRLYRRHFFFPFVPTDLKVRGYSPSASRSSGALFSVSCLTVWRLGGFDLCIVFNV